MLEHLTQQQQKIDLNKNVHITHTSFLYYYALIQRNISQIHKETLYVFKDILNSPTPRRPTVLNAHYLHEYYIKL